MPAIIHNIRRYISGRSAATAIEYGLIVAAVALAIAAVIFVMGESVLSMFETIPNVS